MSEPVFVDASAWVAITNGKDRFHGDALRVFHLLRPSVVELVAVDERIEAEALELFWQYKDKDWGVVDCASLVVMDGTGCRQAFAFDRHFLEASRQYGFSLVKE